MRVRFVREGGEMRVRFVRGGGEMRVRFVREGGRRERGRHSLAQCASSITASAMRGRRAATAAKGCERSRSGEM